MLTGIGECGDKLGNFAVPMPIRAFAESVVVVGGNATLRGATLFGFGGVQAIDFHEISRSPYSAFYSVSVCPGCIKNADLVYRFTIRCPPFPVGLG